MDASAYALTRGVRRTRETFELWRERPGAVVRRWFVGSVAASFVLLGAIWAIALIKSGPGSVQLQRPPFTVGGFGDIAQILGHNLLVLALHAMACVAGFIAGSSLPIQAQHSTGLRREVHEVGRRIALSAVAAATIFSLSWQAFLVGTSAARVADRLHTSAALLLLVLLPHALPELVALFLPLAAWVIASRRGEWEQLLAAAAVTVSIAVPMLVVTALWETFVAPHLLVAVFGQPVG
jgi:hypothetical protein